MACSAAFRCYCSSLVALWRRFAAAGALVGRIVGVGEDSGLFYKPIPILSITHLNLNPHFRTKNANLIQSNPNPSSIPQFVRAALVGGPEQGVSGTRAAGGAPPLLLRKRHKLHSLYFVFCCCCLSD